MSRRKPTSGESPDPCAPMRGVRSHLSKAELDEMVGEAIADCYNESEQATGLYTMLDEYLALPFRSQVLGVEVTVDKLDITDRDEVVVRCCRGSERQWLSILDVRLPNPSPQGWEWIEAFRHWARGRG